MQIESLLLPGVDPTRPVMIAGPCSAESEEQMLQTAQGVAACGVKIFRAGIWKPRTKPGGFEGVGPVGLTWMKKVKQQTGLYTATEVANRDHVFEALKAGVDMLWIGARTTVNPFAVQEIADALQGTDLPILIKNPVNPDLELWIGAIERIYRAGITRIGGIHRGFSAYEKKTYRNPPLWHLPIELRRRIPKLPIFCDPSHIGGSREVIETISQQAMDLNFEGLMIETHCKPEEALSDAKQQVTPEKLQQILDKLIIRSESSQTEPLERLRFEIDRIDERVLELLAQRMQVSKEIGTYKKEHGIPILQTQRYGEIIDNRSGTAGNLKLDPEFVKAIMRHIHEESVRQQMIVMNENEID